MKSAIAFLLAISLLLLLDAALSLSLAQNSDTTTRVSVATDGSQANGPSSQASVSGDGRYVAFVSQASNLVVSDTNGVQDVFVHDRQTGQTSRVSLSSGGDQADGASSQPAISADGRFIAFVSAAANLVADDTNGADDIFVHDRQTGRTVRVSVTKEGGQGDLFGNAANPAISPNGRFVVFDSDGNLTDGDSSAWRDIFVHDRDASGDGVFDQAGDTQTVRVSVASDGSEANWHSKAGDIADDGRFVVFESGAPSLAPDKSGYTADIFLHDRDADGDGRFDEPGAVDTARISLAYDGKEANGASSSPVISGDGRFVVFVSRATNLLNPNTPTNRSHIYAYTRQTGQLALLSQAVNGQPANGSSKWPAISRDGRFVGFESEASDLVSHDTNYANDIFLRDRDADRDGIFDEAGGWNINRISLSTASAQGVSGSYGPVALSDDGRFVVFASSAANLVADDSNDAHDIFVRERRIGPLGYPPIAWSDYEGSLDPGKPVVLQVTANDYDPDGDVLTVTAVGPALRGTTFIASRSQVGWLPEDNLARSVSFDYTVSDGVFSDVGTVALTFCDTTCALFVLTGLCGEPSQSSVSDPTWRGRAVRAAPPDLDLLYRVRDEILAVTPEGQRYTELYYTYSPHIAYHLLAEPGLADDALDLLTLWRPALQALVDGQGESVSLAVTQTQALHAFLERLTILDGGAMRQAIHAELARLGPLNNYAGLSVEAARGAVVGYALYLPLMMRADK
jgi:Tol biopolymer transport system component